MHKQTWFLSYQRSITRKAMVHGGFDFHFLKVVREQEMETVEMVVTASSAAARVSLKSALREWMFGWWETTWGGSARAPAVSSKSGFSCVLLHSCKTALYMKMNSDRLFEVEERAFTPRATQPPGKFSERRISPSNLSRGWMSLFPRRSYNCSLHGSEICEQQR